MRRAALTFSAALGASLDLDRGLLRRDAGFGVMAESYHRRAHGWDSRAHSMVTSTDAETPARDAGESPRRDR